MGRAVASECLRNFLAPIPSPRPRADVQPKGGSSTHSVAAGAHNASEIEHGARQHLGHIKVCVRGVAVADHAEVESRVLLQRLGHAEEPPLVALHLHLIFAHVAQAADGLGRVEQLLERAELGGRAPSPCGGASHAREPCKDRALAVSI